LGYNKEREVELNDYSTTFAPVKFFMFDESISELLLILKPCPGYMDLKIRMGDIN
jgi:hypothetical protein